MQIMLPDQWKGSPGHFSGMVQRVAASLLVLFVAALSTAPAQAVHPYERWAQELGIDSNVSYDGTRMMEYQGQQVEMVERRAPQKMYTEMYMGNMTVGIILREDLKKSYSLMPSMGFYREASMEEGMNQASNEMEFSKIEKVGSEEVNGHPSTKYQTRFSDKEGKGAGFVWVTDTGVPIKMEMIYSNQEVKGQRMTMEFTELNLREQDPAYFEVPANLQPMSFGAGFSNLGKMMGMGGESPAAEPGSAAEEAGTVQSVTQSVSEGTKGLIKGMGIGGLFGMGDDEPEEPAQQQAAASPAPVNLTQAVQFHLKSLGYDPGPTDGEASMQTSIAISQFQAEKGLEVTGEVTPQLAGILEAEVEK